MPPMRVLRETPVCALPDGEVRLLGAHRSVTGAMTVVEAGGARLLVDCGVPQGRERNGWRFPDAALEADAVVLTHGHNDHVGSLPEVWRRGWNGPVIGTPATLEIARIVLDDGMRLSGATDEDREDFAKWLRRAARRIRYDRLATHLDGRDVRFAFREAGHILGSASVEILTPASRVIVSGDLGRPGTPLLRDPHRDWADDRPVDVVVLESTYGDRVHANEPGALEEQLCRAITHALESGGHILVPAFAIGRTQILIYLLNNLIESGRLPDVPVAIDTPMGLKVTELYQASRHLFDEVVKDQIAGGDDPLIFDSLYAVKKARHSEQLRDADQPVLIIAGSGMCTGGRIVGHLRELLPHEETVVLFVGYQAPGTPGHAIQRAKPGDRVELDGEEVPVRARIETISGLSAHADAEELIAWLSAIPEVRNVVLHHGEPDAQRALEARIVQSAR